MKIPPEQISKIGILRALQLGDLLCSIPAIRALRKAYPKAEIVLLGLPWAEKLIHLYPLYFNRFIHFPGYKGLPEQDYNPEAFKNFAEQMREEKFDLLIQMQGNGTIVNDFLPLFGAKIMAGFISEKSFKPGGYFMVYPDKKAEWMRHIKLMQHLEITVDNEKLEFPVSKENITRLYNHFPELKGQAFVCIHPGSRGQWRQWPPAHFALLGDLCVENGLLVVVTGTENEKDITSQVIDYMQYEVVDLTGKTDLLLLGTLLHEASFLIANCTGVAHIAAAVNTPGVIISMDGEPERWGHPVHEVIDYTKVSKVDIALQATNKMTETYHKVNRFETEINKAF